MGRFKTFFLKNEIFFIIFALLILWAGDICAKQGVYAIHAASYQTVGQAQADVAQRNTQGQQAFIEEAHVPGKGKWYRVYIGKFDSRKKAADAAAQLKDKKLIDKIFVHYLPQNKPATKSTKEAPQAKAQPAASGAAADPAALPVYGNKDTKRYHLPGMPYYNKVKKHHRVVFRSEEEAIAQGYYKAGTGRDAEDNEENAVEKPKAQTEPAAKKESSKSSALISVLEQLKKAREKLTKNDKTKKQTAEEQKPVPPPPPLYTPPTIAETENDKEEAFVEPDEKDIVEPVSDSPIYNKALSELKNRNYEQALVTFKEYISRDDTPKEWGQRALRHMADAHYWLGRAGKKEELMMASEFYKNTLENFPDPRPENALTYYRLAKTYEHLKYYSEAIKYYQNLTRKYPGSPLVPEAYYKIGELYYEDKKYAQAEESLLQYLLKYRGKANTKKSYYLVAHSYFKDKQAGSAEIWFRDAMKKWPSFMGVPKDILLDLGIHKMNLRRYDEAISALSFYANIYPGDEKMLQVLGLLADAYSLSGQISPALAVYAKLINKYPDSKEAVECRLKMADLGVDRPGGKVFRAVSGIEDYRNPMDTYDDVIMRYATGDFAEQAMLHKADALVKQGRRRKAADVYLEFLSLFPDSKRIAEASRGLKSAASGIIDEYYAKKDYLAVAYVYFRSFGAVPIQADEYPQVQKIAQSLKELNFMEDYTGILQRYLGVAKDEQIINRVSVDVSNGLIALGKYDDAEKILLMLMNKPSVRKSGLMTDIRKNLADIAYKREQYAQAIANYGDVIKSGQELKNPANIYTRYARSLKEQKENSQALQNYLQAVKYLNSEKREKVNAGIAYSEIGDLYVKGDNLGLGVSMYGKALENATNEEMKLWTQFLIGNTYLKLSKDEEARNMFAQIKTAAGPESFWGQVVDFYTLDSQWWDKYGSMIKK